MSMSIGSSGFDLSQLATNLFSKLDTKQQGFIDKSELSSALSGTSSTDSSSDTSSADALFAQLDGDGDGKITESELSSGLQTLADTLQTQLQQSRLAGAGGPPPPPPPDGADEGFTEDQLTTMASDSSTDSKSAELFSKLAANFDTADTNGDGKVTRDEAISYDQANPSSSSSTSGSATAASSDTSSTSSTTASDDNLKLMLQLMQLLQAYGVSNSESASSNITNSLSVSA